MPGTIYLMNGDDIVSSRRYHSNVRIREVKKMWKAMYGKKFLQLHTKEVLDPKDAQLPASPWKKDNIIRPSKINRYKGRAKPTKGGSVW